MEAPGLVDQLFDVHRDFDSFRYATGKDAGFGSACYPAGLIQLAADYLETHLDGFVDGYRVHEHRP